MVSLLNELHSTPLLLAEDEARNAKRCLWASFQINPTLTKTEWPNGTTGHPHVSKSS